ncbi:MAG: substrate-binding domain-containing protein [Rhizobium sp.]
MQSVFSRQGFTLLLGCSNYDPQEGLRQARAMLARGVEAIAIVGEDHPPELFEALRSRQVPYVVTYAFNKASPHPCVGFDNHAAFREIVEHLLSLGHRSFGTIFQPVDNNDRAKARLQGVKDALKDAGLALAEDRCLIGPSTMDFGASSFLRLMGQADRPTAIICGNDNIALGALLRAKELGLDAPADFSITGFDNLAISSRFHPTLTTMMIDNQEIGSRAASTLLQAIAQPDHTLTSIEIKPRLKIRESTGPVRSI